MIALKEANCMRHFLRDTIPIIAMIIGYNVIALVYV